MIKKIFSLSILAATVLVFTGCAGEEEDLFDQSSIERLNTSKTVYTDRLIAATGGWAMEYYPTNTEEEPSGVGYLLLAKFNQDNTVKVAMKNVFTGQQYKEDTSVWEIISDAGPVLSFNTYNECMHAFSDPNDLSFTSDSETGNGAEGDYEFVVIDLEEDAQFATLKGKKRSTYMRLTRLPEGTDFQTYLTDVSNFKSKTFPSTAPNYNILTIGDSIMKVEDIDGNMPNIYPYNGDNIANASYHPNVITKRDGKYYLRFRDAFTAPDETTEQEFVYDEANDIFIGTENTANTLSGPDPTRFMTTGTSWQWQRTSSMSDAMKTLIDNVYNGFKVRNYTFNKVSIDVTGTQMTMTITYRPKKGSSSTMKYLYDAALQDDGTLKFTFREGATTSSTNALSIVSGLKEYVDAFSDTFKATGNTSNFDLSSTKLTSTTNADRWTVMSNIKQESSAQ